MLFLSRSLVYLVAVDHLAEANMNYAGKIYSHKLPSRDKRANSKGQTCYKAKERLGCRAI